MTIKRVIVPKSCEVTVPTVTELRSYIIYYSFGGFVDAMEHEFDASLTLSTGPRRVRSVWCWRVTGRGVGLMSWSESLCSVTGYSLYSNRTCKEHLVRRSRCHARPHTDEDDLWRIQLVQVPNRFLPPC